MTNNDEVIVLQRVRRAKNKWFNTTDKWELINNLHPKMSLKDGDAWDLSEKVPPLRMVFEWSLKRFSINGLKQVAIEKNVWELHKYCCHTPQVFGNKTAYWYNWSLFPESNDLNLEAAPDSEEAIEVARVMGQSQPNGKPLAFYDDTTVHAMMVESKKGKANFGLSLPEGFVLEFKVLPFDEKKVAMINEEEWIYCPLSLLDWVKNQIKKSVGGTKPLLKKEI